MFNLKVRLKQKWFWITLIPLVFLFFDKLFSTWSALMIVFSTGGPLYNGELMTLVLELVGLIFTILAIIGFPVDLTTDGYGDSELVIDREVPAPNARQVAEYEEGIKELQAIEAAKETEKK